MNKKIIGFLICMLLITTSFALGSNAGDISVLEAKQLENKNYIQENHDETKLIQDGEYAPGELIIKFKDEINEYVSIDGILKTGIESIDKLNTKYGVASAEKVFRNKASSSLSNIYKFIVSEDSCIIGISEEYKNDQNVIYAEPNYFLYYCDNPDDPYFEQQWALHNIGQFGGTYDADIDAPAAWDIETGSSDIVIAIVDSGVDYNHNDITDNIWINSGEIQGNSIDDDGNGFVDDFYGWNFAKDNNDPLDDQGHGTHCAGIASAVADNGIGVSGICWNTRIMSVKSMIKKGGTADWITNGILYATDNGADIISMSFGIDKKVQILEDSIKYAYSKGVVLVGGAGNDDTDNLFYPAAYEEVIAVAATNDEDLKADFSTYGSWVDVAAPGVEILSLRAKDTDMYKDGKHIVDEFYYIASGTSMACPHVAGLAGLILSKDDSLSQEEVKFVICNSADRVAPNENADIGSGRINAYTALLTGPGPADAKITYPIHSKDIEENYVIDIEGSAWGEGFQYYIIDYCRGKYPEFLDWTELKNSTSSVQDGVIGTIDTTNLEEGLYYIRLTVFCDNGIYRDTIWIVKNTLDNDVIVDDDNLDGPWYGTTEHPYRYIKDGITGAGNGDTVYVYNGIYYEHITTWKTTTLVGEDREGTIIDGSINGVNTTDVIHMLADGVTISGFTIQNGEIYIGIPSEYNVISENIIQNCYSGLFINGGSYNKVLNNIIRKNNYGICLFGTNNLISGNLIIDNNREGINLWGSGQLIVRNIITNNVKGIELNTKANNNKIIANNITDNSDYGIHSVIITVRSNYIYYNNLMRNEDNARDKGKNFWYKPEGLTAGKGNYWDDYTGTDSNGDGIGDTPYNVPPKDSKNKDHFPFMEPIDINNVEILGLEEDIAKNNNQESRNKVILNSIYLWLLNQFRILQKIFAHITK
jgi:parallel beta-helix repeat protein